MAILQSYQIGIPTNQVQPFEHYKGKATARGANISATPTLQLNYVEVADLIGSRAEATLNRMLQIERSFQPASSHIPIQLSINKQPRAPMSWSVSYLFPEGNLDDFISATFESATNQLAYSQYGILAWSLQASLNATMYGTCDTRPRIEGYQLSDLDIQITATTDYEIGNCELAANVLIEGLSLSINENTLQASQSGSEDTSLIKTWQYSWSFGVK